MSKTTKVKMCEIASLVEKRLKGFNFILIATNPDDSTKFKYVSNLERETGANILFETALQLELKDCNKLSKIEILNKIGR